MNNSPRTRQRMTLVAVFAVFMLPILFALYLNLPGTKWRPLGVRNHGELLEPPPLLAQLGLQAAEGDALGDRPLEGGWTVLLTAEAPCNSQCALVADQLGRVRLSLGEHGGRVQLLWLVRGDERLDAESVDALRASSPALRVARVRPGQRLPDVLAAESAGPMVHVVDPRGYLILRYPPGFDANGLLKDLQRLLRYAKES